MIINFNFAEIIHLQKWVCDVGKKLHTEIKTARHSRSHSELALATVTRVIFFLSFNLKYLSSIETNSRAHRKLHSGFGCTYCRYNLLRVQSQGHRLAIWFLIIWLPRVRAFRSVGLEHYKYTLVKFKKRRIQRFPFFCVLHSNNAISRKSEFPSPTSHFSGNNVTIRSEKFRAVEEVLSSHWEPVATSSRYQLLMFLQQNVKQSDSIRVMRLSIAWHKRPWHRHYVRRIKNTRRLSSSLCLYRYYINSRQYITRNRLFSRNMINYSNLLQLYAGWAYIEIY